MTTTPSLDTTPSWPIRGRFGAVALPLVALAMLSACGDDASPTGDTFDTLGDSSRDASCTVGDRLCSCLPGDTCNDDALFGALECQAGTCVVPGVVNCPAGSDGCACQAGGSCEGGLVCTSGRCGTCAPGSLGCECDSGDGCGNGLLCLSGECAVDPDYWPCYTPCEAGVTDSITGERRSCPADQLMAGCLSPRTCRSGSCLMPDDEPPRCDYDAACVDFQACIAGRCLSTCESAAECGAGQTCFRKVCRDLCDTTSACPDGYQCSLFDGESGVCKATGKAGSFQQTEVIDELDISVPAVEFSNSRTAGSFIVTNYGDRRQTLTIRKIEERVIGDDGALPPLIDRADDGCFVGNECKPFTELGNAFPCAQTCDIPCASGNDCPLAWLELGAFVVLDDDPGEVEVGETCGAPGECISGVCKAGVCKAAIADGESCGSAAECASGVCNGSICRASRCDDAVRNAGELGVDCGGPCSKFCGTTSRMKELTDVGVEPGGSVVIGFGGASGGPSSAWTGAVEVVAKGVKTPLVTLSYREKPEGRWAGEIHYFSTFGHVLLNEWRDELAGLQPGQVPTRQVGNALLQVWSAFRSGAIPWSSMEAALRATDSGSWDWASTRKACDELGGADACYLWDAARDGVVEYSSDSNTYPVPTGVINLPMAMNLRLDDTAGAAGRTLAGRIETSEALQYAGNPTVKLEFAADPVNCQVDLQGSCAVFLSAFEADIAVGGRFYPEPAETTCKSSLCGGNGCDLSRKADAVGYEMTETPWLVPGFEKHTSQDATGRQVVRECRDTLTPYGSDPLTKVINDSLARSNPIPDAFRMIRQVRLLDGVLLDQRRLVVFFEETFDSIRTRVSGYGYMVLQRTPADLDPADADGNGVPDVYQGATVGADAQYWSPGLPGCSAALVQRANASGTVDAFVQGQLNTHINRPGGAGPVIDQSSTEVVHYLCHETGVFDLGPEGDIPCPPSSAVTYFTLRASAFIDPASNSCNPDWPYTYVQGVSWSPGDTKVADIGGGVDDTAGTVALVEVPGLSYVVDPSQVGTCAGVLEGWKAGVNGSNPKLVQLNPPYRCTGGEDYCDVPGEGDSDLRAGKQFYAKPTNNSLAPPVSMRNAVADAFRYKTRFRNRQGSSVGFTPEICVPGSDQIPYCYSPEGIEDLMDRADCLLAIWRSENYDQLNISTKADLNEYLRAHFAYEEGPGLPPLIKDGFERNFAELTIMLGDESFAQASASRFDLAGMQGASFEGDLFEVGGESPSGIAGFELYLLHQAAQYYRLSLDRFYRLAIVLWQALPQPNDPTPGKRFFDDLVVTRYIEKVVHASTQHSRTWSAIATRYQALAAPDLARRVIERAYTASYLESVMLSGLMDDAIEKVASNKRAAIRRSLEGSMRRYAQAMVDMRETYQQITDDKTFLGIPPDFIPLPTLQGLLDNAFEVIYGRAESKLALARAREDLALESNRSFNTDAASFQSEMVKIRETYNEKLGAICGTFVTAAPDRQVYPAIERYAELNPAARQVGSPCGLLGNGDLYEAVLETQIAVQGVELVRTQMATLLEQVDIKVDAAKESCRIIQDAGDFKYKVQGRIDTLQRNTEVIQNDIAWADRTIGVAATEAGFISGAGAGIGSAATATAGAAYYSGFTILLAMEIADGDADLQQARDDIAKYNRDLARWDVDNDCAQTVAAVNAETAVLMLSLKEKHVDARRAFNQVKLAAAKVEQLRNEGRRLELEQTENVELATNIAAARTDPNVRIYRNDAIINAEVAFEDAMREAYRATRVYEYYTSQSYARSGELYLIRMIARGQYNLENYMSGLQNAFYEFEQNYGQPDLRVQVLSMREDILNVPRLNTDGRAFTDEERIAAMRKAFADPEQFDRYGYLTFPFSTNFDPLSPLTRNHKIRYIEVQFEGSGFGDAVGRVYLRQNGTGVLRGVENDKQFFRLPASTTVVNAFFSASDKQTYDRDIYQAKRFHDRPLVNTGWELVINQRDEQVNQDINLQALTDIKVYLYYTDFTIF